MSSTCRVISSLSYMSIIFAPFLFPIMTLCLMGDHLEVREHARKALWFHLISVVALALLSIFYFELGMLFNAISIICILIFGGTAITLVIWNIVRGVHVLLEK